MSTSPRSSARSSSTRPAGGLDTKRTPWSDCLNNRRPGGEMRESSDRRGISRRGFIGAAAGAAAFGSLTGVAEARDDQGQDNDDQGQDGGRGRGGVALVNGRFVDGRGLVAKELTIKDGRIADVGRARSDTERIDLKGRTVVPGLVDSHAHFTRAGTNPGYETRWVETAF